MHLKWILAAILLCLVATSCTSSSESTTSPSMQAAIEQIQLEPGKAAIVGQVVTNASGEPVLLPQVGVRLATVFWNEDNSDGAFVLEGGSSPGDFADDYGVFIFENIPAGDYVLVVGDIIGIHEIISNPDGTAKIFTATEGQINNIGIIRVSIE